MLELGMPAAAKEFYRGLGFAKAMQMPLGMPRHARAGLATEFDLDAQNWTRRER
jgi:hypothetical protein